MYICDICNIKSYKHKKNLTRHIKEKHRNLEYWLCTMPGCLGQFIRRSYLTRHLTLCHKLDGVTARRIALDAPRGDDYPRGYYEDVSEDDTILYILQDLIDADQLEADAAVVDFNTNVFDVQGADNVSRDARGGDISVDDVMGIDVIDILDGNISGGATGDVFTDILGGDAGIDVIPCEGAIHGDVLGANVMGNDVLDDILDTDIQEYSVAVSDISSVDGDDVALADDVMCNGVIPDVSRDSVAHDGVVADDAVDGGELVATLDDVINAVVLDEIQVDVDTVNSDDTIDDVVSDVVPNDVPGGDDDYTDDLDDDVIVISDDEDDDTMNIVQFEQDEVTQVLTFTYKRQIKFINGVKIIKNFGCVVTKNEYYS